MARRGPKSRPAASVDLWEDFEAPHGLDPRVLAEFRRLETNLQRNGTKARTDPSLAIEAARIRVLLEMAHDELAGGLTTEASNGTPMSKPAVAQVNSLTMRLRGLLNDMGLTPRLGEARRGARRRGSQEQVGRPPCRQLIPASASSASSTT